VRWRLPWRREPHRNDEALRAAEQLRDRAEEQRRRVAEIAPRVDATVTSLRRLRNENHLGPMIENILRGTTR
jgi:hypothetical protein